VGRLAGFAYAMIDPPGNGNRGEIFAASPSLHALASRPRFTPLIPLPPARNERSTHPASIRRSYIGRPVVAIGKGSFPDHLRVLHTGLYSPPSRALRRGSPKFRRSRHRPSSPRLVRHGREEGFRPGRVTVPSARVKAPLTGRGRSSRRRYIAAAPMLTLLHAALALRAAGGKPVSAIGSVAGNCVQKLG